MGLLNFNAPLCKYGTITTTPTPFYFLIFPSWGLSDQSIVILFADQKHDLKHLKYSHNLNANQTP